MALIYLMVDSSKIMAQIIVEILADGQVLFHWNGEYFGVQVLKEPVPHSTTVCQNEQIVRAAIDKLWGHADFFWGICRLFAIQECLKNVIFDIFPFFIENRIAAAVDCLKSLKKR